MAFNYVPKSSEEIRSKRKIHSDSVATLFVVVRAEYNTNIILDPSSNFQFVKISRELESRGVPISEVRTTIASYGVDVKKLRIEYGSGSVSAGIGSAIETKKQEEGSLLYFENYIEYDKFPSYNELKKVYPNVDDSWIKSFEGQARGLKKYLSNKKLFNYYRETGVMKELEYIAKEAGVRKKDAWNPSDVYLVSKQYESQLKRDLSELFDQTKMNRDIAALNDYMRAKLMSKELIGVSLKKLLEKSSIANVEEVNLQDSSIEFKKDVDKLFKYNQLVCNLDYNGTIFSTKDMSFTINIDQVPARAQLRGFPSTGARRKAQLELGKYTGGARLGKVSVDIIKTFFSENSQQVVGGSELPRVGLWKPTDFDKYVSLFTDVYKYQFGNASIDWGSQVSTPEQFRTFLTTAATVEQEDSDFAHVFSNKLQGLHLLHSMMYFDQNKLTNSFLACLFYGAQKQSSSAGPFIKLY